MEQINAPYNFVPLSDKVVIPEWGDKVSHDLPFRDGVSGELELTIEALAPIMVGGEQKQGTSGESGQVHFFQTPDKRYAIPGSGVRGVIRSVAEIATFSRMNRIDDKRYGLRDITGKYVSDSYAGRVRNNISYGFLHLNAQGKPSITPCSMVRLSHRDLEAWWQEKKPIFIKQRKAVKDKYHTWSRLCEKHGLSNPWAVPFQADDKLVTQIGSGTLTGFPVLTGQISDATNDKAKTKGKYKDFMFHSERQDKTFVLDDVDKAAWRDFLFIHGEEDGKPEMSWPGFWKARFWDKQRVPVFYIQGKDRLQIGLAYMPKLAGDFSIHDMLEHTDKAHVDDTKPDFAALLFGHVGEKPENALKGRVYFEPAFLQGQANVNQRSKETILNGAKPSYFPNYIYQTANKSGEKLASGQYATYVYSAGNPAPELRGWKRYPVRGDNEVALQPLGDKQTTKVQTRLHTLDKGSIFKERLVFHNLRPQELGALLWVLQFEGKRHNLGMAKSFGYGQINIKFDWDVNKLVCNDPGKTPKAEADGYIDEFKQYMSETLGEDWRATTPIEALTAMADPACRSQFSGDLKHMVMGMGRNNDFVTAKQGGLVLTPYVQDHRKLKRRSHVSVSLAPVNATAKVESTEPVEGYLKLNMRNKSLFLERSRKTLATATVTKDQIRESLSAADVKKLDSGQGIKVVAQVSKHEMMSVELWKG